MDAGEAGLFRLGAEIVELGLRLGGHVRGDLRPLVGVGLAGNAAIEVIRVVQPEDGLAVDLVVVRLLEVLDEAGDEFRAEFVARDEAGPLERLERGVRLLVVPETGHVVVRPHHVELHALVVRRLEEPVVQGVLQEGASRIPVPVVDEHVYAGGEGGVDLAGHRFGIVIALIAPVGDDGLVVSFEARRALVDVLPFAEAMLEDAEFLAPARFTLIGGPDDCRRIDLAGGKDAGGNRQCGESKRLD